MRITARAWAKTNLHLGVGAARPDGYHELLSVFQTIDLADTLTLSLLPGTEVHGGSVVKRLSVTGPRGVPEDAENLAWQAVDALVERWRADHDGPLPQVELHITKGIPVAGGMAGGSADAAAALRAVDVWLGPFGEELLFEVAAELGSDVPFCLLGGTMVGTGRGEKLVDLLSRGRFHWVVAVSAQGLSTPEVFRKYDELDHQPQLDITGLSRALLSGDVAAVAAELRNDLQVAAFSLRPELRQLRSIGMQAGAAAGLVSGSGPTLVFLCASAEVAADVAEVLVDSGKVLAAHTASGPVPAATRGAHIVSIEERPGSPGSNDDTDSRN